jgi:hypothetical protein
VTADRLWPSAPCRSCGARIVWAVTAAGRRMPLDPDPDAGGTIRVHLSEGGDLLAVIGGADDGRPLYRSHFATCPQASAWRARDR